ncbi:uncharacterized protein PG998_000711 [Apiospora kogelbergensis]|uniref:Uncharacterized protein n=1 Tax=Apiospora kogelbergensis TaxID=1337665 RepID=A0AAW0QWK6_9PEZI
MTATIGSSYEAQRSGCGVHVVERTQFGGPTIDHTHGRWTRPKSDRATHVEPGSEEAHEGIQGARVGGQPR